MFRKAVFMKNDPNNLKHLRRAMRELSQVNPEVFGDEIHHEYRHIPRILMDAYQQAKCRQKYWLAKDDRKSYLTSLKFMRHALKGDIKGFNKTLSTGFMYDVIANDINTQSNKAAVNDVLEEYTYNAYKVKNTKKKSPNWQKSYVYINKPIPGERPALADSSMLILLAKFMVKYINKMIRRAKRNREPDLVGVNMKELSPKLYFRTQLKD